MAKQASKNRSYELKKLKAECVAEENQKYMISQHIRKTGTVAVEPGNKAIKTTPSEVFIYIVGNAEECSSFQEQFKKTKNFKKTKVFGTVNEVKDYIGKSKFPNNSIIILFYVVPGSVTAEEIAHEIECVDKIKEADPTLDAMLVTSNTNLPAGSFDFVILKNEEMFGKIITNITWAIREQDRIRKQVESKQFIKMAIIVFVVFFVLLFAVDFITGLMDTNPNPSGIFGIVPIPHE
ncbi:MAG: hypothetical protein MJ197_05590 [Bacteroidales bacterium]|nr:hypothetical protein [Bacteroidales bacterium]